MKTCNECGLERPIECFSKHSARKDGTYNYRAKCKDCIKFLESVADKPECVWPECNRPAYTKGLCTRDYQRAKHVGFCENPWEQWDKLFPTICVWPNCESTKLVGRFMCSRDYTRASRLGFPDNPWVAYFAAFPHKASLEEDEKYCRPCSRVRKRSDFHRSVREPDGLKSQCRDCDRESGRQYTRANPERSRAKSQSRRASRANVEDERVDVLVLRERDGDHCYYCGTELFFGALKRGEYRDDRVTHEHIVPIRDGGANTCLLYTSPSPRDRQKSRMPSSA